MSHYSSCHMLSIIIFVSSARSDSDGGITQKVLSAKPMISLIPDIAWYMFCLGKAYC